MTLRPVLLFGLVSVAACAQIDGKTDEARSSAGARDGDSGAESKDDGGTQDGAVADPEATDANGADANGDGISLPDAGDSGPVSNVDAQVPPPPPPKTPDGTCSAPFELTFSSNRATGNGNTTGAGATVSPKCSPAGGIAGAEHVYHFRMPFKGRIAAVATGTAPFVASATILTACGDSASEKACNYAGTLSYDAKKDEEIFLYVDSGSKAAATPSVGAYSLRVTLREEAETGRACGGGDADPYCLPGSLCQEEAEGSVCRAGNPETCGSAYPLSFHPSGGARVARVFASTSGAKDEVDPICINLETDPVGPDHVYSFTVTASTSIAFSLKSAPGYDAALVLLAGQCVSAPTTADCFDTKPQGGTESESGTVAAGNYFLVVDSLSLTASAASGSYDLTVTLTP